MRKLLIMLMLLVMQLVACAGAEIYRIDDESQLPEGWNEKELLRLTAIDADRSDAMLLQCGGENMMIDGGSQQFYERLEELFAEREITEFKYLYNTHPDTDHIHGLTKMMNSGNYQIGGFCSAVRKNYNGSKHHTTAVRVADRHGIPYVQINDGDVLNLGGATINVLRCNENWGTNNRSAACQIVFGNSKVLLMGDCAAQPQRYFAENYDHSLLQCDIIKASHHGINGFVDEILEAAQPKAVFVTNYRNHSSIKSGYRRYYDNMGQLYSGDGTIIMETDGTDWYIWQLPNWKKNK